MEEVGPALLLAVVGYITLRHCANRTKFRWAALEWEQNVFESAAVGAIFFTLVRVVWALPPWPFVEPVVRPFWPLCRAAAEAVRYALPFPYSASLVATFALAIGVGYLTNIRWRAEPEVRRAVRDHGGDLRIFLHDRAEEGWPVSLTMKNRKVYVGLILAPPGLEEPCYLTLLPTLSGYRDEQTLTLKFTTAYEHVYEDLERQSAANVPDALDLNSFGIVLPLANIESANRYDHDVYTRYFGRDFGPSPPTPTVTTPPAPPGGTRSDS